MPPKKPARKIAQAAKKTPARMAKPARKSAPQKSARKPTATAPKSAFTPPAVTFMPRTAAPHTPAAARVRHTYPFPWQGLAAVTWAYIWRLWLCMLAWGVFISLIQAFFFGPGTRWAGQEAEIFFGVANILASVVLGVLVMAWVARVPRLLGGYTLMLAHPRHPRAWQAFGLWFSYTWRRLALFLAGLLLGSAVAVCVEIIAASFPLLGWSIGVAAIAAGVAYFVALVPYLSWQWVLKKQTFAWGRVELHRVKR